MAEAVQSPAVTAAVREQQSVVVEAAGDRGRQAVVDATRSLILQLAHVQETAAKAAIAAILGLQVNVAVYLHQAESVSMRTR